MLIGFASLSDLPLSFLQRLELRYQILLLPFLSMISVSYGLQLRESRPLHQDKERPQVPETAAEQDATVQGLAEAELADLDAQPADIAEDEASDRLSAHPQVSVSSVSRPRGRWFWFSLPLRPSHGGYS
jgi:hypothetical protein